MAGLTRQQKQEKLNDRKYISRKESYRWTDNFIDMYSDNELWSPDMEMAYKPPESKMVNGGSWILVLRPIPVVEPKPKLWHIYWATPCKDSMNFDGFGKDGRYRIEVSIPSDNGSLVNVGMFPHEYMVLDEEKLGEFLQGERYKLVELDFNAEDEISLELIEKGRALSEEEREVIWALMLDGLSESEACSEYFCSRHINKNNAGFMYVPNKNFSDYLTSIFI